MNFQSLKKNNRVHNKLNIKLKNNKNWKIHFKMDN